MSWTKNYQKNKIRENLQRIKMSTWENINIWEKYEVEYKKSKNIKKLGGEVNIEWNIFNKKNLIQCRPQNFEKWKILKN